MTYANEYLGPVWANAFNSDHHPLHLLRSGDNVQVFVQLDLGSHTILVHPFEGSIPLEQVGYDKFPDLFKGLVELKPNDRTDGVLHLRLHPLNDPKMNHFRYYKKFIQHTRRAVIKTSIEFIELTSKLYPDNMERFRSILPKYPYWTDGAECPMNAFYASEVENNPEFVADALYHGDDLLAVRCYYDTPTSVFWARTLRTFAPDYENWKVGTAATVALIAQTYELYGMTKEFHIGLEMDYKPRVFKSCAAWEYEARLGSNLILCGDN